MREFIAIVNGGLFRDEIGAPTCCGRVIVWEGQSRGPDDLTDRFAASARSRGLTVKKILTI